MSRATIYTSNPVFNKISASKIWLTIDPSASGDLLEGEVVNNNTWSFSSPMPGNLSISSGSYGPRLTNDAGGIMFRLEGGDIQSAAHSLRVGLVGSKGSEKFYDLKIFVKS